MEKDGIILPDSAVRKQKLYFKDSEALVILAKGDSRHDGVKIAQKYNCECWGLNDIERFPELTLLFELHDWDERVKAYNPLHLETKLPVMMKECYPEVPNSIKFPMQGIADEFGTTYFNNQVCQMLAFAIQTKRFKRIYLFGVDYNGSERPEQEFERPCTEFWCGVAMGRGIDVFISQQSNMMTYCGYYKGVVYCYTPDYQKPFEEFKAAQPNYWAEYLLGHYGGRALPPDSHDHDDWMSEMEKFTRIYIHNRYTKWQAEQEKLDEK